MYSTDRSDKLVSSINDAMFLVDMGGTAGLVDLASRLNDFGYGIKFAVGTLPFTSS